MMSTRLLVFALTAVLIASIGMTPVFGQSDPITVTTDKASYISGETIVVSGTVAELIGQAIAVQVIAPNGNIVQIQQISVNADKTYSVEMTAGGALMRMDGDYTVKVQYGGVQRTAETTFAFGATEISTPGDIKTGEMTGDGTTIAVPGTEFAVGYEISGGSILSITPDVDASSLIIGIDATEDGSITVTLPRSLIDAKMGDVDDTFFVLVDGEEVDFEETKTSTERVLTIDFPAGAEEIEIIGTFVVPEFGTIAALVLAVAIISIIAVSARSRLSIMPRY